MYWKDLPVPFYVLVVTGAWCPEHWPKSYKIIYSFYSLFAVIATFSTNGFQIAKLLFIKWESFEEFNDTFNIALSVNAVVFKLVITLLYHDEIVNIIKMLEKICCQARDEIEKNMQKDYDNYARKISKPFVGIFIFAGIFKSLAPLKVGIKNRELPFTVLLPYNLTNPTAYGLTYVQHCFCCVFVCTGTSISVDLVIAGFLLDLCCQCDILKYRIEQLPRKIINASKLNEPANKRYLLRDIVQHHIHLYNVAKAVTRTFGGIIIHEFYVNAVEIGVTIYQFTLGTSNADKKMFYLLYVTCMLGQLFLNCYFGNEVAMKSGSIGDALYHSNWTELSVRWKKDFLIIIRQSKNAITISTRAFVHLMLETFVKIVKASYTGYNITKTSA